MKKLTIVGGGIVGAFQAYYAFLEAQKKEEQLRITVYDAHPQMMGTTAMNIAPSLTPDEIMSVVPRGPELIDALTRNFNQTKGIKVEDVKVDGKLIHETEEAKQFIASVLAENTNDSLYNEKEKALLALGRKSMRLWKKLYDDADPELKQILEQSNFNPCGELKDSDKSLHQGYRIDLISGISDAADKARKMRDRYHDLDYTNCKLLSPEEACAIDPYLTYFCKTHSENEECKTWKNDAVALWRPGGCIDIKTFLPLFYQYLEKQMKEYTNPEGLHKKYFHLKHGRAVQSVIYDYEPAEITGLTFTNQKSKRQKNSYEASSYVFCPGSAVGTLKKLGFKEPDYSGFAGASLKLIVPLSPEKSDYYHQLNHCMEVHQEGIVLAWQVRKIDDEVHIAVAGTKAFYGVERPHIDQDFAKDRNLLQLNMINDVLPDLIAIALGKEEGNTESRKLTAEDLAYLENNNIAKRWVGVRAVAYDNFPTWGPLFHEATDMEIKNGQGSTHFGSGGVSFAPIAAHINTSKRITPFLDQQKKLGISTRKAHGKEKFLEHQYI